MEVLFVGAVAFAASVTACWCAALRALNARGVLPPASLKGMRGWRVPLNVPKAAIVSRGREVECISPVLEDIPVYSHYAIFSDKGPWGQGQLDHDNLLVFLHGWGAQLDQLTWGEAGGIVRQLVAQGLCVLALDWVGHGYSDAPDGRIGAEAVVAQMEALLQYLGVGKFDLFAFSMSSQFAAMYAAKHPTRVQRLVLMSPFGGSLPLNTYRPAAFAYALIVRFFFAGNLAHFRTLYRIALEMDNSGWGPSLAVLKHAQLCVLVICGSEEEFPGMSITQTAHMVHEALPGSTLRVISGAHHMTWATGPKEPQRELRDHIATFLRDGAPAL